MCKPFYHLLQSPWGHYFYDVNRNEIVSTTPEIFELLETLLTCKDKESAEIMNSSSIGHLRDAGYLSDKRPNIIQHPSTNVVENFLDGNMEKLTLQLTQNCNFKCSYCAYANPAIGQQRTHSSQNMSVEIAKKAVNFLFAHSMNICSPNIGFYGGEPLLNFSLLKEVVEYADELFQGRTLSYSMTTNGSLFTDEVIEFCLAHNIIVLVSLDGPKEIQDQNRKLAATGGGTFDIVMKNLSRVQRDYPDFFEKLSFNMVVDPQNGFDCYNKVYLDSEAILHDAIRVSFVDTALTSFTSEFNHAFTELQQYEIFLAYMSIFNRVSRSRVSPIALNTVDNIVNIDRGIVSGSLQTSMAPSGPCLPGVQRAMCDISGNLFPCERCSETANVMKIGHIDSGFDVEHVKKLLNIGALTADKCKNCWAILFCTICASHIADGDNLSVERKHSVCGLTQNGVHENFLNVLALREFKMMLGGGDNVGK